MEKVMSKLYFKLNSICIKGFEVYNKYLRDKEFTLTDLILDVKTDVIYYVYKSNYTGCLTTFSFLLNKENNIYRIHDINILNLKPEYKTISKEFSFSENDLTKEYKEIVRVATKLYKEKVDKSKDYSIDSICYKVKEHRCTVYYKRKSDNIIVLDVAS